MTGWALALLFYVLPMLVCARAKMAVGWALCWPAALALVLAMDALDTYRGTNEWE